MIWGKKVRNKFVAVLNQNSITLKDISVNLLQTFFA